MKPIKREFTYLSGNAIEWVNENNFYHNEEGPAVERTTGIKEWYLNGWLIGSSIDNFNNEKFLKLMSPKLKLLWNGDYAELKKIAKYMR